MRRANLWVCDWPRLRLLLSHACRPPPGIGRYRSNASPFPLDRDDVTILPRLSDAIWHGVCAAGLVPGHEVLAPAYHHGTEIEALLRAGLVCSFYEIDDQLEPDADALSTLVGTATRALLLTHFLGIPQDTRRWRRWCDGHGILLIENCAWAWLATTGTDPVGSLGDMAVFGPSEALGTGLGSILSPSLPPAPVSGRRDRSDCVRVASHTRQRLSKSIGVSDAAYDRLRRVADPAIAGRRRANYAELVERIGDHVPPGLRTLPAGASPHVLPVFTDHKPRLLADLWERQIGAMDGWQVPHRSLAADGDGTSRELRSRLVGVPVHQELIPSDIDRIAAVFSRRRAASLRSEVWETFGPLQDSWPNLAVRAGNVFGTLDWVDVWWKHHGAGRRRVVVAFRDRADELVGICPMHIATGHPLRLMRFIGYGPADQLGPVCAPRDRGRVARALPDAVRRIAGWDVLLAEQLAAEEGWSTLSGGRVVQRAESPILRFDGSWDDFLASRSSHMRKFLRWQERKLGREHGLAYRMIAATDPIGPALDELARLHRLRWPSGSRFASEFSFHREFAERAHANGWLRLWFLELDGQPVAAWYCLQFAGAQTYYQSGRDPLWDKSSVGLLLICHAIQEAFAEGIVDHRFGRGAEGYKYRLARDDAGLETIGFAATSRGRAALAVAPSFRRHRPTRLVNWFHGASAAD